MRLWLDDLRPPPDGTWVWAKNAAQAIRLLEDHQVTEASLDHDLADIPWENLDELGDQFGDQYVQDLVVRSRKEKTGYEVVLWLAEHGHWPTEKITIHSWNPVGGARMASVVDRYGPYEKKCRHIPHQNP